ncbi:hypothetical protein CSW57_04405 [Williamsia muralis]|uniref:Uncharacterized protein n=1 Tax=Williamsia marianensis TaxID=85044 RepID=A0A2G3PRN4_WILMA|nr:hypothetical protein CSW57_04405 [Williamsia marianensis]
MIGLGRNQRIVALVGAVLLIVPLLIIVIDGQILPLPNGYTYRATDEDGIFNNDTIRFIMFVAIAAGLAIWILVWQTIGEGNETRARTLEALAKLQNDPGTNSTDFDSLWQDNRKRLNIYHDLVTRYAQSTRIATIATIGVGFVFIVIISVIAVLAKDTTGAIASSVIGASGALLTGFIANAVLKNAASSQSELLSFFSHPLEVERALSAERIINDIGDPTEKAASQRILIEYLTGRKTESVSDQPTTERAEH